MNTVSTLWTGLRTRRLFFVGALLALLPLVFIAPRPWGTVLAVASLGGTFAVVRAWRCPRCARRFAGAGVASWPDRCATCALPAFAEPSEVHATPPTLNHAGNQLPKRLRQFLAATQMVGGVFVMGLVLRYSGELQWWYTTLLESLGFFAVFGGWLLWRDHREGYRLTRMLQWMQLVKLQGALGAFAVAAGFSVELIFTSQAITISSRQYALLALGTTPQPFYLAINVFAVVMLVLLAGAAPGHDLRSVPDAAAVAPVAADGFTV